MNEIPKTLPGIPNSGIPMEQRVTQAAEGLPRWRWTLAEFDYFIDIGVLGEDDRVELIGGEIVPMAAKSNRHERVKTKLLGWMYRRLPDEFEIGVELGWRPGNETYCEPDLAIIPATDDPSAVAAPDALLVIEIAKSSLAFDLGRKAELYAQLGVRDYWVVNALTLETRVHRQPGPDGFGQIEVHAPGTLLLPLYVAAIAVKMADLKLGIE